ncbi:hypothetical protein JOB18_003743 [Solea senegalensis]|uniref:Uncharacterized protein n=1 Tax=Solea senegalensis TaxID=28829 RepID=A0AAV6S7A4_SOLSE|nr:hypothetical protein JOB18_003743 [Solea senegalensis]
MSIFPDAELHHKACSLLPCNNTLIRELSQERPLGPCLSGRFMRQPVLHCKDANRRECMNIRRADLSLSLFIFCVTCNHRVSGCCVVSTVQHRQPWDSDSQILQAHSS